MSEDLRQAIPDAKKPNPLLPILGIVMAVSLGIAAYFVSPIIIELLEDNVAQFNEAAQDIDDDMLHYAFTAFLWFSTFSTLMALVAVVAARPTVVEQEQRTLHPRLDQLTSREARKYENKIQKQRQKKIETLKRMKAQQEREERRKK